VWRYGAAENPALVGPTSAQRLSNGNTLITDTAGGAVIEVRSDTTQVARLTSVNAPRDATRLADGTTLIADQDRHRVVTVSAADNVTWQFGVTGTSGSDASHLKTPRSAQRLADGSTVISDSGNGRVVKVSLAKEVLDITDGSGPTGAIRPGSVQITERGTQLIADSQNHRLVELGYVSSGTYVTGRLRNDGVNRWFVEITPQAALPTGTALKVEYRFNSGAWKSAGNGAKYAIPTPEASGYQEFRFTLSTTNEALSPTLMGFSAAYFHEKPSQLWFKPKPGGSKGTTGTAGSGSGNGTGTGTTGGTGTTAGTGGTGTGTGSGSGSGNGTGTGTGGTGGNGVPSMRAVATGVTQGEADALLSGYVMDERVGGVPGVGGGGGGSQMADIAGLAAAFVMLSLAYSFGVSAFGSRLLAASRLARALVVRSLHG